MHIVFLIVLTISLVLYCIQTTTAWWRFRGSGMQKVYPSTGLPPISILKPLKGLDDGLEENLESFCRQDYAVYEVVLCVEHADDPACEVARRVMGRHPECSVSLVVHNARIGLNPKVNNLAGGYAKARYDLLLVSDSNVRVRPDYLRNLISCWNRPSVGLVSNYILGTGARSPGACLENLHLNSFVVSSINFLDRCRDHQVVVGKSMLFSRRILEEVGGLGVLKDVLAEDYVMGRIVRNAGRTVVLSPHMIKNVNVHWSLAQFWKRHTRWGQLRLSLGGPAYLWELVVNPVFLALLPFLAGQASPFFLRTALIASVLKMSGDCLLGRRLGADIKAPFYLLVPFKDFLVGMMWFYPFFVRTVTWRGNKYRIAAGSKLRVIRTPDDLFWPRRLLVKLRAKLA